MSAVMFRRALSALLASSLLVTAVAAPAVTQDSQPSDPAPPSLAPPSLAGALSSLSALGFEPGPTAEPAPSAEQVYQPAGVVLPRCKVGDKRTRYHKVKHWRRTLLDTELKLKRSYKPWDLVSVSRARIAGSGKVRKLMIKGPQGPCRRRPQGGQAARRALGLSLV